MTVNVSTEPAQRVPLPARGGERAPSPSPRAAATTTAPPSDDRRHDGGHHLDHDPADTAGRHGRRHPQRRSRQRHDRGPRRPQRVATIGNTTLPFIDLGGEAGRRHGGVGLRRRRRCPRTQQATCTRQPRSSRPAPTRSTSRQLAGLTPDLILVQVPSSDRVRADRRSSWRPSPRPCSTGSTLEWKALADAARGGRQR